VDHVIHALAREMLPSYEDHHKRQRLGMQGPDLAKKRRKQILARAPETPLEQIKEISQSRFEVQSTSSEKIYEINILTYTCTCSDFPRIQLCKHVAATVHFFRGGLGDGLRPQAPNNASASEAEPVVPKSPAQQEGPGNAGNAKTRASMISTANDITCLALEIQEILVIAPANLEMAKSLQMARSQLNAMRLGLNDNDGSWLPEKEQIGPNQLSWPPTATQMGVKCGKKRRGKVDSALTGEHIGAPKRKRTNDDPYGAGEHSGKRTKPNAVSTAANTRAHAAAERPPPASLPTRVPPSPHPVSYAQTPPLHAPAMYPPVHFPAPYSQPGFTFQYPASQPAPSLYPFSSYYTFPPA
jgi:hypothetical protein